MGCVYAEHGETDDHHFLCNIRGKTWLKGRDDSKDAGGEGLIPERATWRMSEVFRVKVPREDS